MTRTIAIVSVLLLGVLVACAQDEFDDELKPPADRRRPSIFRRPDKESAAEQLAWAKELAAAGKTGKAMGEYRALVHQWHSSPQAVEAQEAYARLFLEKRKYHRAFDEFQYLIDHFAGQFAYAAVVEEQFKIAHYIMTKRRAQWFGMPGFTSPGLALPYFEKVVANAPAGKRAPESQFYIGVIHEQAGDHEEAAAAFRTVFTRYRNSDLAVDAQFRHAHNLYKIANSAPRDKALCRGAFSELAGFVRDHPQSGHVSAAEEHMNELRERLAGMYYDVALFYDRPVYRARSALIAYTDFIRKFPSSDMAPTAKNRIDILEARVDAEAEAGDDG